MQEELLKLLEIVKNKQNKTQEQIAVDMGYGETYISTILRKGVPEKFLSAFKLKYARELGKVQDWQRQELINVPTGRTIKDYIDLYDKYANVLERLAFSSTIEGGGIAHKTDPVQTGNAGNERTKDVQALEEKANQLSRESKEKWRQKEKGKARNGEQA